MNKEKQKQKQKQLLFYIATKISWLLVLALGKMARIRVKHVNNWYKVKNSADGLIFLLWHGKLLLLSYVHRNQNLSVMVSEHGDGEIIAQAIMRMGYRTVRGSSTRGGRKAFREMLRQLKKGEQCVVTPDGPNGPRHEVKMGALLLAQLSGAYLLPTTCAVQKPIYMNSWDRFTLWWPFSRACVLYGEPIKIPRKLSNEELEQQRRFIQDRMMALEKEADEVFRS
ncbi:DUF374 domain-containing protein [candidate division KSB1 bacterium]|nr:lysophospholipid acyltransferase family protein [candidate division KSB1 bacterium]RQW00218.1 MAG: DUF374 domain-containing protein [candidate division KSB1 bacterium]